MRYKYSSSTSIKLTQNIHFSQCQFKSNFIFRVITNDMILVCISSFLNLLLIGPLRSLLVDFAGSHNFHKYLTISLILGSGPGTVVASVRVVTS